MRTLISGYGDDLEMVNKEILVEILLWFIEINWTCTSVSIF